MLGSLLIATIDWALTGLQVGRLTLLGMQTNFDGGRAVQANGRLVLLEGLTLLTAATDGRASLVGSYDNLRAIIRNNHFGTDGVENERHWERSEPFRRGSQIYNPALSGRADWIAKEKNVQFAFDFGQTPGLWDRLQISWTSQSDFTNEKAQSGSNGASAEERNEINSATANSH
jgi:hypothetical protein